MYIALDPGFDAVKVVANGKVFKFPFVAIETDERKITDYGLRDEFLLYRDEQGSTYRVGAYAREILFDKKQADTEQQMNLFYSENRFISKEFLVGLRTAISLAMEAQGDAAANTYEIHLMVALPHSIRQKYAAAIVGNAAGKHHYTLQHGNHPGKTYDFEIREDHIHTVSQTIAAILGETSDDDGNVDQEKFFYLSNGPTLVIDGGYYTTGLVVVSRGGSVDDEQAESNTDCAMRNVNEAIAEEIRPMREDVKYYMVEYLLQNGGKLRYLEDGKAKQLDINQIRKEKVSEICQRLIDHINRRYNNLLDCNYVLVTGGTGAVFYAQLKKFYVDASILDADHVLLASSLLAGQPHSIEYAVAIGAYKGLMGISK